MSRIWFVTGSSRGLGRAIVEAALGAGDTVIATARKPEQLADLVEQYRDRVLPLALDVSDYAQVQAAVEAGHRRFGRLDVIVNNAGYGDLASVEDMEIDVFRAQIDTNFYGVVYVTKAVLPILRQQGGGHIFQVSSLGARIGTAGLTAYQSAKWAVGGFSLGLAQEIAPFGIKITVLEPGGMLTDWAGSSMTIPPISASYEQTVGALAAFFQGHSGNQQSSPSKLAGVILTLLDDADPPLRLLLGPDAFAYANQAAQAQAESDDKWRDITLSTAE